MPLGLAVASGAALLATTNVVSGRPELRLSLPLEPQPVTLPPALAELAGTLDRLDAALALVGGIRQSRQLDVFGFSRLLKNIPENFLGA